MRPPRFSTYRRLVWGMCSAADSEPPDTVPGNRPAKDAFFDTAVQWLDEDLYKLCPYDGPPLFHMLPLVFNVEHEASRLKEAFMSRSHSLERVYRCIEDDVTNLFLTRTVTKGGAEKLLRSTLGIVEEFIASARILITTLASHNLDSAESTRFMRFYRIMLDELTSAMEIFRPSFRVMASRVLGKQLRDTLLDESMRRDPMNTEWRDYVCMRFQEFKQLTRKKHNFVLEWDPKQKCKKPQGCGLAVTYLQIVRNEQSLHRRFQRVDENGHDLPFASPRMPYLRTGQGGQALFCKTGSREHIIHPATDEDAAVQQIRALRNGHYHETLDAAIKQFMMPIDEQGVKWGDSPFVHALPNQKCVRDSDAYRNGWGDISATLHLRMMHEKMVLKDDGTEEPPGHILHRILQSRKKYKEDLAKTDQQSFADTTCDNLFGLMGFTPPLPTSDAEKKIKLLDIDKVEAQKKTRLQEYANICAKIENTKRQRLEHKIQGAAQRCRSRAKHMVPADLPGYYADSEYSASEH